MQRERRSQVTVSSVGGGPIEMRDNTDIAVLWSEGEFRCVLSWTGERFRVRLMKGDVLLRQNFEQQESTALAVSRRWRLDLRPDGAGDLPEGGRRS